MRAVTLYAFGVTVYGNNDSMKKKRHDKKKTETEMIDLFSLFYRFCCFDQSNQTKPYERQTVFMIKGSGFPPHSEIKSIFALLPYFCTPNV